MLCDELSWSSNDIQTFQKLVKENYGYKLFLDDLPSATTLPNSEVLYTENIPLGYKLSEGFSGIQFKDGTAMDEIAIFNHLDITVMIHPTILTKVSATTDKRDAKISTTIYRQEIALPLP